MRNITMVLVFFFINVCKAQKIKVLNFGTFHMASTTDKFKIEYDAKSKKSDHETTEIARVLAKFKPTVFCVELLPKEDSSLRVGYNNYLKNPDQETNYEAN